MRSNKDTAPRKPRPQNTSCPAGGTKQARSAKPQSAKRADTRAKRGVVVTPPSRNTSQDAEPSYAVVHRGFDTLALSVKQSIPVRLFDQLSREKESAEEERRETLITIEGRPFLLKPYGGKGYAFILSDGEASATWALKKPNAKDPWGIRISIGSRFLAVLGLGAARAYIDTVLDLFGIRYLPTDISIARVDYCVDILAPDFTLIPDNFVMHSSTKRRDHIGIDDMVPHGTSGRVESVTIGGTQGRQIIVYDKRAEIIAHAKPYWWDIWLTYVGMGEEDPMPTLCRYVGAGDDPTDTLSSVEARKDPARSRVWRAEVRAGKDLLKDRWDIRTWEDLFARYGDLIREACEVIRYTVPNADTNRARWPDHPLWELAADAMREGLFEMVSGADPNAIREVVREEKRAQLVSQFVGLGVSIAALDDVTPDHLPDQWQPLGKLIQATMARDPERYAKQLREASERYVFVRTPTGKGS